MCAVDSLSPHDDRLTVVMPFYNAAATIARAVRSLRVVAPEHRESVRLIAIDDGSIDGGADVLRAAMCEVDGIELSVLRQANAGSGPARNAGLAACSAGWVLCLDADDELTADPVPLLRSAPEATAALFRVEVVRAGRRARGTGPTEIPRGRFMDVLTARNPFPLPGVAWRREAALMLFDVSLEYLEDWAFWMANPAIFERVESFPAVTVARVHAHGANKTSDRVRHGHFREKIALRMLRERRGVLTSRERANLRVQARIGRMQQGRGRAWRGLADLRSDPVLYAKFLAHLALGRRVDRLDPYGAA